MAERNLASTMRAMATSLERTRPNSTRATSFIAGRIDQAVCGLDRDPNSPAHRDVFGHHCFCALQRHLGQMDAIPSTGEFQSQSIGWVWDHGTTSLRWAQLQAAETSPGGLGSVTLGYGLLHSRGG